jgi:hypothetical protein
LGRVSLEQTGWIAIADVDSLQQLPRQLPQYSRHQQEDDIDELEDSPELGPDVVLDEMSMKRTVWDLKEQSTIVQMWAGSLASTFLSNGMACLPMCVIPALVIASALTVCPVHVLNIRRLSLEPKCHSSPNGRFEQPVPGP